MRIKNLDDKMEKAKKIDIIIKKDVSNIVIFSRHIFFPKHI